MALEALSSNELLDLIMNGSNIAPFNSGPSVDPPPETAAPEPPTGRRKRRRRARPCKNKEEAEAQRMTHIAVERNRRKQMNEHLAVLRSLMPESYVQRGDQASIVGGAIEFVKELEHILHSLEAKKFALLNGPNKDIKPVFESPFAQFFVHPQFTRSHNILGIDYACQSESAVADIEVTLIETHANIRILTRRGVRQLSRLVAAFRSVLLTILHLNVTTLESLVLYSISVKVEEGCQLNSADEVAGAVHHMLKLMEEEAVAGFRE
ncbi:basic helix-loop-helix (bHLH) DNA-bindingsuperfamily protein [Striga asiatica]|uniref:Basic helix-loop-helix (BHLH) DNA-bindingsuperfamily protein n=1 Tax=Striga asiatica TaxID=4170 RepID=A0A5A7R1I6_STRAF|nr:basic helix-loop-helix (bHLH) DNA-bindingsuperfamily protein [Striga asiatica]